MLCSIAILTDVGLTDVFGHLLFATKRASSEAQNELKIESELAKAISASVILHCPTNLQVQQVHEDHLARSTAHGGTCLWVSSRDPHHQLSWLYFYEIQLTYEFLSCSSCNDLARYKGEPSNPRGSV